MFDLVLYITEVGHEEIFFSKYGSAAYGHLQHKEHRTRFVDSTFTTDKALFPGALAILVTIDIKVNTSQLNTSVIWMWSFCKVVMSMSGM